MGVPVPLSALQAVPYLISHFKRDPLRACTLEGQRNLVTSEFRPSETYPLSPSFNTDQCLNRPVSKPKTRVPGRVRPGEAGWWV